MTPTGWPESASEAVELVRREIAREYTTAAYFASREAPGRRVQRLAADVWCQAQHHHPHPRPMACHLCIADVHQALTRQEMPS